jgi:DNA (cytosine-5)-methyltransferase 1
MMIYFNDIDANACAWLAELQRGGEIPPGKIDQRSITDVRGTDLVSATRVHLFAGIAGWELACRIAGWPDSIPLWSMSCPCQPFSTAGRRKGHGDDRNLWPECLRLIRECRPAVAVGEQVAAAIGFGWLDRVFADLENEGYAVGAAVLPACGVGAPHRRDRLWWCALALGDGGKPGLEGHAGHGDASGRQVEARSVAEAGGGDAHALADGDNAHERQGHPGALCGVESRQRGEPGDVDGHGGDRQGHLYAHALADGERIGKRESRSDLPTVATGRETRLGDGLGQWYDFNLAFFNQRDRRTGLQVARRIPAQPPICGVADGIPADLDQRRFPLAKSCAGRTKMLKGLGNAIVPQVAAVWLETILDELNAR